MRNIKTLLYGLISTFFYLMLIFEAVKFDDCEVLTVRLFIYGLLALGFGMLTMRKIN